MRPTRATCPFCHTPVPLDLFEKAFGDERDYLVCPECDYLFLTPRALLTRDTSQRDEGGSSAPLTVASQVELECSTSD